MAAKRTIKDTRLSLRVPARLKKELEEIAQNEGRSVAQVSEVLLGIGLQEYGKKGSAIIQQWVTRQRTGERNM